MNGVHKELIEDREADNDYIDVDRDRHVLAEDAEVLLEHLYHDVWVFNQYAPKHHALTDNNEARYLLVPPLTA